jgi:hypothetical protein
MQTGPLTLETEGSLIAEDNPARPKEFAPCILVVEDDSAIRELTTEMTDWLLVPGGWRG